MHLPSKKSSTNKIKPEQLKTTTQVSHWTASQSTDTRLKELIGTGGKISVQFMQ